MTKTFMLLLLVLALGLAGCVPKATPTPSPTPTTTSPSSQAPTQGTGMSITELAATLIPGAAYTCSFESIDNAQRMQYVIQDKKISMTMESATAGNPQSRFMSDGQMIYVWDPETNKGTKMKMLSLEEMQQMAADSTQLPTPQVPDFTDPDSLAEIEQNYRTVCSPTVTTDAEFVPPSTVEFQDMTAIMDMMKKYQAPQP